MEKRGMRLLRRILVTLVVILAGVAVFFGLFYVTDVQVVGNTRYTEAQISEMTLQGPLAHNSVLMSAFRKTVYPDAAFVESVKVAWLGRNSLRLEVQEKYPIGYVNISGTNYYFDKDGLVLEALSGQDTQKDRAEEAASSSRLQTDQEMDASSAEQEEQTGSAESGADNADTAFRPALTDVPLITGLAVSNVSTGSTMKVGDPSVFQTILSLTKLIDKFGIQPDYVEFSGANEMTLHYSMVRIQLGGDSYLEEKVSRVAAILPELNGMSGVLHLEEYTKDTQNIIFDRDTRQSDEEE